jgi:choline dehydrogenase-like flavoprotein
MVLANRLTASGEHSVIVLEAGPEVRYVDEVNDPFAFYDKLSQDNEYSWEWQTVNQTVGGARKTIAGYVSIMSGVRHISSFPRGKALGGSTSSMYRVLPRIVVSSHPPFRSQRHGMVSWYTVSVRRYRSAQQRPVVFLG